MNNSRTAGSSKVPGSSSTAPTAAAVPEWRHKAQVQAGSSEEIQTTKIQRNGNFLQLRTTCPSRDSKLVATAGDVVKGYNCCCCTAVEREVTGIQVAETRASESQPTKQLSAFSTFKFLRVHYAKLYSLSYRTYILQARRATINTVVLHNSAERERT